MWTWVWVWCARRGAGPRAAPPQSLQDTSWYLGGRRLLAESRDDDKLGLEWATLSPRPRSCAAGQGRPPCDVMPCPAPDSALSRAIQRPACESGPPEALEGDMFRMLAQDAGLWHIPRNTIRSRAPSFVAGQGRGTRQRYRRDLLSAPVRRLCYTSASRKPPGPRTV